MVFQTLPKILLARKADIVRSEVTVQYVDASLFAKVAYAESRLVLIPSGQADEIAPGYCPCCLLQGSTEFRLCTKTVHML